MICKYVDKIVNLVISVAIAAVSIFTLGLFSQTPKVVLQ